jgi:hypothetical protein
MAWVKMAWSITGCIAPGSMPRPGSIVAAGLWAAAGAARTMRTAAMGMMRVLM